MRGCCSSTRKPPVELWEVNKPCTIQRPKLVADGATENTHGEIDYTSDSNWVTLATGVPFAIRPMRGRQVEMAGNVVDVVTAQAWAVYSTLTSTITPDMRLVYTAKSKTYQVAGMIDWYENEEWVGLWLAEFNVEH